MHNVQAKALKMPPVASAVREFRDLISNEQTHVDV